MNALDVLYGFVHNEKITGVRICFETAQWLSSDGSVKSYYHIHVQHDNFPDYNSGVGAGSMVELVDKLTSQIIPEIELLIGKVKK